MTLVPFLFAAVIGLAFFLWPLYSAPANEKRGRRSQTIAFYKDQLKELNEDIKRGTLDEDSARAARIEIERRLLGLDEGGPINEASEDTAKPALAIFAIMLIGLGSYLYASMGSPLHRDSWPLGELEDPAIEASLVGARTAQVELSAFLEESPDDGQALFMGVQLASQLGENGKAANLLGRLSILFPENVDYPSMQGEALVWHADGLVTPAARLAFERALMIEPRHPSPRFYQGLWHVQNGRPQEALQVWRDLLTDSADDAPWFNSLSAQIARVEQTLGLNPNVMAGGLQTLSQGMIDEVNAMSEDEQAEFINGMIERLRQRLLDNPDDLMGWLRLARAAEVAGNVDLAMEALLQAESLAPPQLRGEITARYLELAQGI